jgi:NitT/TauT family transport system substrate-binding protein
MNRLRNLPLQCVLFGTLTYLLGLGFAHADDIEISQYGVAPGGMPYAIALSKGWFQEEGADVTGIRSSPGGAPTIRNLLGGELTYAEAGPNAVLAANRSGADVRIIAGTVNTLAEIVWVTLPDSPIKTLEDFRGKRIGFTTPQSTTQALAFMLLDKARIGQNEVQLIAAGGFPQALTALEHGGLDVAAAVEPSYTQSGGKYRAIFAANDVFPPMANVLGLTTARKAAEKPAFLRGVIAARRRAVKFMAADPGAAATIIAAAYKLEPSLIERVIRKLLEHGTIQGVPYWGEGDIRQVGLDNMVRAQKLTGSIEGEVNWAEFVDESFLPPDLRRKK